MSPISGTPAVLPIQLRWYVGNLGRACAPIASPSIQIFVDSEMGIPSTEIATVDVTTTLYDFDNATSGFSDSISNFKFQELTIGEFKFLMARNIQVLLLNRLLQLVLYLISKVLDLYSRTTWRSVPYSS